MPLTSLPLSCQLTATTLLLVRHGDVYNPDGILYGRLPRFHLSDLGERQAAALALALRQHGADVLYSSPQLRARQTARIISTTLGGLPIHTSRLIAEVVTGYQGLPGPEARRRMETYADFVSPDDETLDMLAARMSKFLTLISLRHGGKTVVAVSHGDPIIVLRAYVQGLPMVTKSIRGPDYPAKCSITEFRIDGTEKSVKYRGAPKV